MAALARHDHGFGGRVGVGGEGRGGGWGRNSIAEGLRVRGGPGTAVVVAGVVIVVVIVAVEMVWSELVWGTIACGSGAGRLSVGASEVQGVEQMATATAKA